MCCIVADVWKRGIWKLSHSIVGVSALYHIDIRWATGYSTIVLVPEEIVHVINLIMSASSIEPFIRLMSRPSGVVSVEKRPMS